MKKLSLGIAAISIFLLSLTFASAEQQYNCPMGSGGMMYGILGGYGAGMMLLSWLLYLAIIILIGAAIYWFVKSATRRK